MSSDHRTPTKFGSQINLFRGGNRAQSFINNKRQIFSSALYVEPPDFNKELQRDQISKLDFQEEEKLRFDQEKCEDYSSPAAQKVIYYWTTNKNNSGFSNELWKTSALIIVYHISKFIKLLYENCDNLKFRLLGRNVFKMLNDQSSDYDYYVEIGLVKEKQGKWNQIARRISRFIYTYIPDKLKLKNIGAIQPDGTFKILWDTLLTFLTVVNIFYIPMKLAFNITGSQNDIQIWAFILDILINFNTAFYLEGIINSNRKSILFHYLKGDFLLDFVVISVYFVSRYQIPYIDFVLLLRVRRVKKNFDNIEESLSLRENFAAIIDLVRLIYFVVLVGHFCACAWYFLATFEDHSSWLHKYQVVHASTSTQYIVSLYWSVITLLTVGYGDITPMIFVIIMALITCGVFGYAINSIGAIFREMEQKKDRLRTQMALINSYMRRYDIDVTLRYRVRKYFEYYFKRQEEQDEKVQQLLGNLAPDLKNDMLVDMYRKILTRSKLLRENLSHACLNKLSLYVKEQQLSPDEFLFQKSKPVDKMFFVLRGRVKISFEKQNQFIKDANVENIKIRYYKEGYVLGEKNFLLKNQMEYSAQAAVFSKIAYIDYDDFINCVKLFPNDFEKLNLLKDKLIFNSQFKKVFTVCEVCGSNHTFGKCPFPFYQINKGKILYVYNSSRPHDRKYYLRNMRRERIALNMLQQASLALCLNKDLLREEDLDDNYLMMLGFGENVDDSSIFDDAEQLQIHIQQHEQIDKSKDKDLLDKVRFHEEEEPKEKKGILKKSSFLPNQVFEFSHQKSSSEQSETSDIQEIKKSTFNAVQRKNNRHKMLSMKYDNANRILSQMVRMNSMYSQKSVADHIEENTHTKSTKLKQIVFDRQITTQTNQINTNTEIRIATELITQIKCELILDFDRQKAYKIYFPESNLDTILNKINRHRYEEHNTHISHKTKQNLNIVRRNLGSSYIKMKIQNQSQKKIDVL